MSITIGNFFGNRSNDLVGTSYPRRGCTGDSSDLRIQPQPHTFLARVQHESHHHAVRIDKTVSRAERAAKNVVRPKLRHHLHDVFRRDPFDVPHAERILPFTIRFQVSKMIFVCRAEEITMCAIIGRMTDDFIELRKEVDRILRHLNVDRRRELRADTAHTLPGRALALMRLALDHQHVRATGLREMISDARANDAAADDDDVCSFSHSKKVSRKGAKIAKKKGEQSRSPLPDRCLSPPSPRSGLSSAVKPAPVSHR